MNWFKTNKGALILSVILCLTFVGFYKYGGKDALLYSWIFLYLGVRIFFHSLPEWKWLKPLIILIEIPAAILALIGPFVQTFLMIIILFLFSFGVLALILLHGPEYVLNVDLNYASKLYLILIIGSVLLTKYGGRAIQYFNSIINNTRTEEREQSQLNLTLAIISKKRIVFLLYLLYFIYLIPYSIALLSNTSIFPIPNVDKAIFSAFISYTAFERIVANKDMIKMNSNEFLSKLFDAWK